MKCWWSAHGDDRDALDNSQFFREFQLDWFSHFKIEKLWNSLSFTHTLYLTISKCQKPNIIQFDFLIKEPLSIFFNWKPLKFSIEQTRDSAYELQTIQLDAAQNTHNRLLFALFWYLFFRSLHSLSSFFFSLALTHHTCMEYVRIRVHTHTQFKMNGFKLTKNSERTHSLTHTHILCRVEYMCRQATSIEWWTRWVLYALFYLIWFNSFGFFYSRNAFHIHTRQLWRDDDFSI